jgi:hypothetical protein
MSTKKHTAEVVESRASIRPVNVRDGDRLRDIENKLAELGDDILDPMPGETAAELFARVNELRSQLIEERERVAEIEQREEIASFARAEIEHRYQQTLGRVDQLQAEIEQRHNRGGRPRIFESKEIALAALASLPPSVNTYPQVLPPLSRHPDWHGRKNLTTKDAQEESQQRSLRKTLKDWSLTLKTALALVRASKKDPPKPV